MKNILTIFLCFLLTSCAFLKTDDKKPIIPIEARTVTLAPETLMPCKILKDEVIVINFEDAIIAYGELADVYGICANKQKISIKLLKEFSGVK